MVFMVCSVLAVVFLLIGIYYLIPGVPHPLTTTDSHVKHFIVFLILAAIAGVGALVNRSKPVSTSSSNAAS